jgi:hypothetical protein
MKLLISLGHDYAYNPTSQTMEDQGWIVKIWDF